jgi:hypothetical protein
MHLVRYFPTRGYEQGVGKNMGGGRADLEKMVSATDEAFALRTVEIYGKNWNQDWMLKKDQPTENIGKKKYTRKKAIGEGDDDKYDGWYEHVERARSFANGAFKEAWYEAVKEMAKVTRGQRRRRADDSGGEPLGTDGVHVRKKRKTPFSLTWNR